MQFTGLLKEQFWLSSLIAENCDILKQIIKTGLTIFWSREDDSCLVVDGVTYTLKRNQIIFLTEFHKVEVENVNQSRLLRFNRPFYCINHNSDDDCNGTLFYRAAGIPIIELPAQEFEPFETLWKMLNSEMQLTADMQIDMLRTMLKQLVIHCTRLYNQQTNTGNLEKGKLDVVRKFNSLVEMHYKSKHSVADYADLLNKSSKTLSNLFLIFNQKTPLQIIHERRLLEAKRLLSYTEKSIKEITYDLGFEDIQSFSRFFKKKEGESPTDFRLRNKPELD